MFRSVVDRLSGCAFVARLRRAAPGVARHRRTSGHPPRRIVRGALRAPVRRRATGELAALAERLEVMRCELAEREAELRAVYDAMPCSVIAIDTHGVVVEVNEATLSIYGLEREAVLGHVLDEATVGAVREDGTPLPLEERPAGIALRTGQPVRDTVLGLDRHDGTRRWIRIDAVPLLNADGVAYRVVLSAIDVTAPRLAEGRLRRVYTYLTSAVIVLDADGCIVDANAAAEMLLGADLATLHGQPLAAMRPLMTADGRYLSQEERPALVAVREKRPARATGWLTRPDGSRRDLQVDAVPLFDADGAVEHVVVSCIDITERKRLEERLAHAAYHDALTGLANRALFQDRLEQALLIAARTGRPCAVLLIDLDCFKEVNDTFGHATGDALLQAVAGRIHGVLRGPDTAARLGGDEFAVALPDTDEAGAVRAARKVAAALAEPFDLAEQRIKASGSIGVAYPRTRGVDAATLLRQADQAMYAAKRSGGGVVVYTRHPSDSGLSVFHQPTDSASGQEQFESGVAALSEDVAS